MAKKFKVRIENVKPVYESTERTISCNGVKINGIVKNVYNEVGRPELNSDLEGVDPNGVSLRAITYGRKDPLFVRYEYIQDYNESYDSGQQEYDLSEILGSNFYYEHDKREKNPGKKQVFRYEKKARPYVTYDEEYFQHIFNWPTSHTMQPRQVGAFIQQVNSCTGVTTYFEHSAEYPGGSMTLDKVVSELYYIDDNWGYQPLTLNADGTIQDSSGDITDRIGDPVIYHGGTDTDCLFFHYVVDLEDIDETATDNLVVVGDTVNGATITNVVNYIVDVSLKRTISKHPKKGDVEVDTNSARFIELGYTQADFNNTKAWLKLNTADGIAKGNVVTGKGIRDNTVVTAVDEARSRVYISQTLSRKKVKLVRFLDNTINRVNKNTLCYATISGGSFAVDTNYPVLRNGASTGITVCARAGKGIINRSAIVGTYFSKNKKEIEYDSIFYSSDPNCQKEYFEDDNGVYVLGTVIWEDNSRISGKYLLTEPKNSDAYKIASIYQSFTYALIDKDTLEMFLSKVSTNSYLDVYNQIKAYTTSNLAGKKAAANIDDICRDDLNLDYLLAYDPIPELGEFDEKIKVVTDTVTDDCFTNLRPEDQPTLTVDGVKDKFSKIIADSVANSTVMTQEYYTKLVGAEDSLINRINEASATIKRSVPDKTKVNNLPPSVEGQDDSGVRWIAKNFRDLPPSMDRVKFFPNDVMIGNDKDLDPTLDLDPQTTRNQPKIIIRSKPCWIWGGPMSWPDTKTHAGCPGAWTSTISVNVTLSGGYLDKITSASLSNDTQNTLDALNEAIASNPLSGLLPLTEGGEEITVGVGIQPAVEPIICPGENPTPGTCSRSWTSPTPKNADKNIVFGEKKDPWNFSKVSSQQPGYIAATNCDLHPDLRDLDNKDRSDDSDILAPAVAIYPKTLWAPNINYQMDYHKLFSFRMEEVSELLGETITNFGNPYLDSPIRSKLTKDIGPSDTTIHVQSTDGFLTSGYLIIPKYTKKLFTTEMGNVTSYFTYCGEEIIYYKSKTSTTFNQCERELFGTTSDFEITLPAHSIEVGTRYRIESLGTTNWETVGAGKNAQVGTVFTAVKDGDGSGTVQLFGSGTGIDQSQNIDVYEDPPKIPFISSYEKGFSISQHWVFTLKED